MRYRRIDIIIGLTSIIFSILAIYFVFVFQRPKIKIFNKTNYNLDSLKIGEKYFNVKGGDSLVIDKSKDFLIQGEIPLGLPQAKIKGKVANTFPLLFCGTEIEEVKRDIYQFDITLSETAGVYRLFWERHN